MKKYTITIHLTTSEFAYTGVWGEQNLIHDLEELLGCEESDIDIEDDVELGCEESDINIEDDVEQKIE